MLSSSLIFDQKYKAYILEYISEHQQTLSNRFFNIITKM